MEELLGLDGVVEEADQGGVLRLVEVVHPQVVLPFIYPKKMKLML